MTTTNDSNGGTKTSETSPDVTAVIKTPLPTDASFPKVTGDELPRAVAEPPRAKKYEPPSTVSQERKPGGSPWISRGVLALLALGLLLALVLLANTCNAVKDLSDKTASLETKVDTKVGQPELEAFKNKIDKKVDLNHKTVNDKLDEEIKKLEEDLKKKADQSAIDELKKDKADKNDLTAAHWRITRVEKKFEQRVVAAKEPSPTPPMPMKYKTSAPVVKQPTHNVTIRPVPVYIDEYKIRSRRR